jgi:hypothetical protein
MIRWSDKQLAAAGIDGRRLAALVRRLRASAREMEALGLDLSIDRHGDACLVRAPRQPSTDDAGDEHGTPIAWIGRGLQVRRRR